jgi:hypothetical protein
VIRRNGDSVATIDAGQPWMDEACEQADVWTTSRPSLCAQYGKSFARITSQASRPEDDPSTDAGLPLLQVVPSEDRWITSASFVALPGFTNAITVVGTMEALGTLTLDEQPLGKASPVRRIGTSSFGYVTTYVTDGSHRVHTDNDAHRFMLWTYGSIDGLQPARIYGSVASMNMAWDCADSVVATMNTTTDSVIIDFGVTAANRSSCLGVAMAYAERCDGGIAVRRGDSLVITRTTPTTMVDGVAVVVARSGRYLRLPFRLDGTTNVYEQTSQGLDVRVYDRTLVINTASPIDAPVVVYDVTGAVVGMHPSTSTRHAVISLHHLAPGVYLVTVNGAARRVIID